MKPGCPMVSIRVWTQGIMDAYTRDPDGTAGPGSVSQDGGHPTGGELNAAIARAAVRIHRECVGRGPTKAQAFFRGNIVVVILENVLVKAELTLLGRGLEASVIHLRKELLETMRPDLTAAVEGLTDRSVTTLMGDNSFHPDIASQVFVLDGPVRIPPPQTV
jgi:uncharacterized protein YbcI